MEKESIFVDITDFSTIYNKEFWNLKNFSYIILPSQNVSDEMIYKIKDLNIPVLTKIVWSERFLQRLPLNIINKKIFYIATSLSRIQVFKFVLKEWQIFY